MKQLEHKTQLCDCGQRSYSSPYTKGKVNVEPLFFKSPTGNYLVNTNHGLFMFYHLVLLISAISLMVKA